MHRGNAAPGPALGRAMRTHKLAVVPLLALLLCLQSCFTTALWSLDSGDGDGCDGASSWTLDDVLWRIALTPLTLLLDCATAALQDGADDCGR